MENDTNYTLVGIFVLCLLIAIILSIIWLSSGFTFKSYSNYIIYMKESVSGLNVDSPVEYNGVEVGSVKSIEIDPKNPQIVELILNVKSSIPITRGTIATLTTRGITGLVYIALKDTGNDLHPLLRTGRNPYPIIPTSPSIFVRIDTALTQISDSFKDISSSMRSLLDEKTQLSIKHTIQHLDQITNTLAYNSQKLNSILANTVEVSHQMIPLMQSSNQALQALSMQILPKSYETLNSINEVSRALTEVSAKIKQNPAILIRGSDQGVLGPGETP